MSERHYTHLELKDRELIEEGLLAKKSISSIAKELGVSPATVSREIIRNRRDDGYKGTPRNWGTANTCMHRRGCEISKLCSHCSSPKAKVCSFCTKGKCKNVCKKFEEEICERIAKSPHVCNGCHGGGGCRLHRYRYSAKEAQALAEGRLSET